MSSYYKNSAIDDRFAPTVVPEPQRAIDDQGNYTGTAWPPPGFHSAPRSGHWTVDSSIGSAIDDRCPTEWNLGLGSSCGARPQVNGVPVDSGLLRKLGRTAVDNRKTEVTSEPEQREPFARASSNYASPPRSEASARGFFLPDRKDLRDTKAQHKAEQDRIEKQKRKQQMEQKKAKPKNQPPSSPKRASPGPIQNLKTIRIVGKDGEEAFVEIPALPQTTQSNTPPKNDKTPEKQNKQNESKKQQKKNKKQETAKAPTPPAQQSRLANNSSGRSASNIEQVARSTRSISVHSLVSAIQTINENENSPHKTHRSANSSHVSRQTSSTVSHKSVAAETQATSVPSHHSLQSLRASIQSINANSERTRVSHQSVKDSFIGSAYQPGKAFPARSSPAPSQHKSPNQDRIPNRNQNQHQNSPPQPPNDDSSPATIYAGRGWISPHPLSAVPSAFASPPQSAIQLPNSSGHQNRSFTYNDFKAAQNQTSNQGSQTRNASRSMSHVSARYEQHQQQTQQQTSMRSGSQQRHPSNQGSQNNTWDWDNVYQPQQTPPRNNPAANSSPRPYISPQVEDDDETRSAAAYRERMNNIISPTGGSGGCKRMPVHLAMPWDENGSWINSGNQ